VVTLECVPELARTARDNLRRNGLLNVQVRRRQRHRRRARPAGEAPFDVIVLSGSVAEVPQVLLEQLKVGGRLAAIVGDEPVMRATHLHPQRRGQLDAAGGLRHRGPATAGLRREGRLPLLSRPGMQR
jgi:protein-L-isoaspartate O-methyltransferase